MSDSSIIVLWSTTLRPKRADLKQFVQKSSLCRCSSISADFITKSKMKMFVTDAFDGSMFASVSSQIDASVAFHNPTTTHLHEYPAVMENRKNGNPKWEEP
ncbi:hypothetical protein TB2_027407 [Malus domestica]